MGHPQTKQMDAQSTKNDAAGNAHGVDFFG
jgi:hypothetical protein